MTIKGIPSEDYPLEGALSLAIEALSWVGLKSVSGRSALSRAAEQLEVSDRRGTAEADLLVRNVLRRKFSDAERENRSDLAEFRV